MANTIYKGRAVITYSPIGYSLRTDYIAPNLHATPASDPDPAGAPPSIQIDANPIPSLMPVNRDESRNNSIVVYNLSRMIPDFTSVRKKSKYSLNL